MSSAESGEGWCDYANAPCADSVAHCSDGQYCMRRTDEKIRQQEARTRADKLADTVDYLYVIDGHRLGPGEQN